MAASLGKNHGTLAGQTPGTFAGRGLGSLPGKNPCNSSAPPKLGRNDLIKAVQAVLLQFPVKKVAEDQDTTTKAVECQRNGDSAMSLLACANMCRSNARARALLAPLFGFSGHYTDPDFMEGMEKMALGMLRQQFAQMGFPASEFGGDDAHAMSSSDVTGEDRDDLTGDLFEGRA